MDFLKNTAVSYLIVILLYFLFALLIQKRSIFFLLLFIAKSRQLCKEDESRRSEHANNSKIRINDADSIVVELPENVKK